MTLLAISKDILICSVLAVILVFSTAYDAHAQQAQAPWESAYSAKSFGGDGGQGPIREVFCDIAGLMQGSLGGLLASAAAVIAIGGAAFGDFTNAKSAMVVAIGGATILAGVSLYFGDMECGGGNNANTPAADTANPQAGNPLGRTSSSDPFDNF